MRNRSIFLLAVAALIAVTVTSCGNRYPVIRGNGLEGRDVRHVTKFKSINIEGKANVFYAQADTTMVIVKSDKNIIPFVYTTVEDGCLHIYMKDHITLHPSKKLSVLVYSPSVAYIHSEGVGTFYVPGKLHVDSLSVHIEGVGSVRFADSLFFHSLYLHVEGIGGVKATKLRGDHVSAHIEGVGKVKLGGVVNQLDKVSEGIGRINTDHLTVLNRK